jgi:hypothetical protein
MLAALLIWLIVILGLSYLLYRFFKWSLTILWRALNYRIPFRETQLSAREEELNIREKDLQAREQDLPRLKAYLAQEYQEWWEKLLGIR